MTGLRRGVAESTTQSRKGAKNFLDCSHGSQEIKDFLLGIRRVGLRLGVAEGTTPRREDAKIISISIRRFNTAARS